jgi:hypothetical protein
MFKPDHLQRGFGGQLWRMGQHSRTIDHNDLALIPAEVFVQRYALGSLLTLNRVQSVEIVVRQARLAARESSHQIRDMAPDRFMSKVRDWLRKVFLRRGMAVEVVLRSTW